MRISLTVGILAGIIALYAVSQSCGQRNRRSASWPGQPTVVFVLAPVVRIGPPELRFPDGSRIIRLTPGSDPASARTLTTGFFAAADPQVATDGEGILFAGRKNKSDPWQIWKVAETGAQPSQITHCNGDCLQPVLLSNGQLAYTLVTRNNGRRSSAVWVSNAQGKDDHPITFGPGDYQTAAALRSGRVLVSARWPLTAKDTGGENRTLYTMRPDGSGLTALRDTLDRGHVLAGATELSDGTIVFVQSTGTGSRSGAAERLAWLRPGALRASPLMPGAAYQSVAEMPGGRLLISRASSVGGSFDLYAMGLDGSERGSLVYAKSHSSAVQAVPAVPYPAPERYWSILHPGAQTGRVLCLNAYLSQDVAGGRIKGNLTAVRVLALDSSRGQVFPLGVAPVESDGSFYVSVPANTPIRFELLGRRGEVVRAQRGWIWVRNGEDRGCLGCHESHALAPENRSPRALQRLDAPVPLTGRAPTESLRTAAGAP